MVDEAKPVKAGSRDAGEEVLRQAAELLLVELPIEQRVKLLAEIARDVPETASANTNRLAALKYANELNGIVTVADDRRGLHDETLLPAIVMEEGVPAGKVSEAIKLMAVSNVEH